MRKIIKIKNEKHSKRVQEKLFNKGYRWVNTGVGYWRLPSYGDIMIDTQEKLIFFHACSPLDKKTFLAEVEI